MDPKRRQFLGAAGSAPALVLSKGSLPTDVVVTGSEHWARKEVEGQKVRLFLWRKRTLDAPKGVALFVHGASSSGRPAFDLQIPGRPASSTMDWFARLGYDSWCVDCEGYGRSDKSRPVNDDLSCGADDVAAASEYILKTTGQRLLVYGAGAGSLRAGLFAQRYPDRVRRLVLDDFVWTGEGSAAVEALKSRLPQLQASTRTPIERASFDHETHAEASDPAVVDAFAEATLALDSTLPAGPWIDLASKLPLVDPEKVASPTLVLRGQWDAVASFDDLAGFFARLPRPDKQLVVLPGIARGSMRSKNRQLVYELLDRYFSQPAPAYTG